MTGTWSPLRFENWKLVFAEQKTPGTLDLWGSRSPSDGVPLLFNLRMDPYERAQITSNALVLDFFAAFLGPLETELAMPSAHASGRAHGMADLAAYTARINATNFALANDDGTGARDYARADVC